MTGDQIVAISEAMDADAARATPVRSTNAERQQRFRDNRKAERNDSNVTRNVTPPNDISNPPFITPNDDKSSLSPKPKRSRKPSDGESLPDGWEPVLTPAAQMIVDGWPPGWLDERLAEFRDHASDKARKSNDWQAAFRTWLTKADTWGRPKNANSGKSSANGNRGGDGFISALREAADRQADHPATGHH
ncbi:MAG: hypothetical protein ACSLE1_03040 [Sphingobium sp.]